MELPYYVKALYAGVVAFLGSLSAALLAGGEEIAIGDISTAAWVAIILATVLAIGGVLGLQAAPATVSTSVRDTGDGSS